MQKENVEFTSGGETVRALFMTPDGDPVPRPTVVMAGGWCYVKELVLPRYARRLVESGFNALLFDLRCLGESDGLPRQELDPWAQIEDYRSALDYLETRSDVDPERLAAWGISYSGGHALILGAIDPRVKCVIANVPVIDGYQNMRLAHGTLDFRRLQELIAKDRRQRADGGDPIYLPHAAMDRDEMSAWPFPETYEAFKQLQATDAPNYQNRSTVRSVDLLMHYSVWPFIPRLLDVPTLMIVAQGDDLVMWELELEVYNAIPTAKKRLEILQATTHMTLYSDEDKTEAAAVATVEWCNEYLRAPAAEMVS